MKNVPVKRFPFEGVVFDMDGTLTRPVLDFDAMRRELGAGAGDIAAHILGMPPDEQQKAWATVARHEEEAIPRQRLQPGARALLTACRRAGVRIGLLTRNAQRSVDALCERYGLTFDAVVTRDFPFLKPHPGPVLHMLETWGIAPSAALMVGDYIHDIECGRAAGTATCFYHNPGARDCSAAADCTVRSMKELQVVIVEGYQGRSQKERIRACLAGKLRGIVAP